MKKKTILKKLEEKKFAQKELEIDMYHEIILMFTNQLMRKSDNGMEHGISDEDILIKLFGKTNHSKEQVKLVKKLRQKYQKEHKGVVGERNSSGEYKRYYPKNEEEQDRYITTRKSCVLGQAKGLIKSIKANSHRLKYDWKEKSREVIGFVASDTRKYINSGDGDFVKQIEFKRKKQLTLDNV